MDLKQLIEPPSKLPTVSRVVQQLIASFGDEDVSIDAIARQIALDPALTAKLLRLANSAYFHVSRTVSTVDVALRMLGFVMVRNLVLGNGMAEAFRHTPGLNLPEFWRYNLYTACAARWLAAQQEANSDLVFTVGLMHGIGQLQMHAGMPEQVAPLDRDTHVLAAQRSAREQEVFGFHHGDVAAELARVWNFPPVIVQALRQTPQPLAADAFSEAAAWVHLGAWRARVEVLQLSPDEVEASYPSALGQQLHLDPAWMRLGKPEPGKAAQTAMPALSELTEGLEVMFE